MDDIAQPSGSSATRGLITTSQSSTARPSSSRKGSGGSVDGGGGGGGFEKATRRGVGGGSRKRSATKGGGGGGGERRLSLVNDENSVRDLRFGRKGSRPSKVGEDGGGGGAATSAAAAAAAAQNAVSLTSASEQPRRNSSSTWARNHTQVKIISATRLRKGSHTSFKDLVAQDGVGGEGGGAGGGGVAFSAGGAMLGHSGGGGASAAKKKSSAAGQRGRATKQNKLMVNGKAGGDRRRSSSTRRSGASSPKPERSGSLEDVTKQNKDKNGGGGEERRSSQQLRMDSLAQLAMRVKAMGLSTGDKAGEDMSEDDQKKLASICNVFAGGKMTIGKKTFKDFAREEIMREPSEIDRMIAGSKVIAAFGRRNFDEEEINPNAGEPDEDDEDFVGENDHEELKFKVKAAKAKYLAMFEKKVTKEEEEKKKLDEMKPDPKAYGLWDSVSSIKALPTLMKAKREWVPQDWDKIMEKLKEEGRDVASIDADLREICRQGGEETAKTKTGKYLMPDDIAWCRKHARFKEKDLLKWFRRFREKCPKGTMNRAAFAELFKIPFPLADVDVVTDIVFEVFDPKGKQELDFKEFLIPIDAVNCREYEDKLRWALTLWDQKLRRAIDFDGMKRVIQLMDQVEENGYMDGPTDEDMDEIFFRKKLDPPKLVEDRATDIFHMYVNNADGTVEVDEIAKTPSKVMYARE